MTRIWVRLALFGAFVAGAAGFTATPASAQATRTWVSGVGDDVNPCSRTAPCKTFAGAISKTAAGGEINCLDPGGYGAVTITKSMTISCPYTEGGALAGGNGITINDGATATPGTAVVYLRGLDIFGVNPPSNGVRFVSGAALHIEDSTIRRFNAANSFGVSFQPGTPARLFLNRVTIADNGSGATGGGILIKPTGTGSGRVVLENVRVADNANIGVLVDMTGTAGGQGVIALIDHTLIARSTSHGLQVLVPPGANGATIMVANSSVANNVGTGIVADGAAANIRVGTTSITGNGTGVASLNTGSLRSYGNNRNDGNAGPDGAFILPNIPQE
jgi:hypothetical protein